MFEHIRLSDTAISVLRFELRGWKAKDPSRRTEAYRELADAGLMEAAPAGSTSYRFRQAAQPFLTTILEREEARELSERRSPPDLATLSLPALTLLERYLQGESPTGLEDERLLLELVGAGALMVRRPFDGAGRPEYRLSPWASHLPAENIKHLIDDKPVTLS